MITTARRIQRTMQQESGKVLVMALILLVMGSLILTPLLGLMSTGLAAGLTYDRKTAELYAADAGVEHAIWHLQTGGAVDDDLAITVNDKNVTIKIEEIPQGCQEDSVFAIESTATSADGSSTTIRSQVTGITVYFKGDKTLSSRERIGGNVYVEGTLVLSSEAEITGNVITGEDLILNAGSLIGGIVCVGRDLALNNDASIQSDVYVMRHVALTGGDRKPFIEGVVRARGNVFVDGIGEIRGPVWAGGDWVKVERNAKITGDVHVWPEADVSEIKGEAGHIYYDYNDDWACPLEWGGPEILTWDIS